MRIENRQLRITKDDGTTYVSSQYRYVPEDLLRVADGAGGSRDACAAHAMR